MAFSARTRFMPRALVGAVKKGHARLIGAVKKGHAGMRAAKFFPRAGGSRACRSLLPGTWHCKRAVFLVCGPFSASVGVALIEKRFCSF